jgi:hypothetical protein
LSDRSGRLVEQRVGREDFSLDLRTHDLPGLVALASGASRTLDQSSQLLVQRRTGTRRLFGFVRISANGDFSCQSSLLFPFFAMR